MNSEILETTEGAVTEKTNILTESDTLITNTHTRDTVRSQRKEDKKKHRDGNSEKHTQLYQEVWALKNCHVLVDNPHRRMT